MSPALVELAFEGRDFSIECEWVGPASHAGPIVIFLHEGLGSVSMWRDFPARLCTALGLRGLVYSRPGYGRSTPRAEGERWQPDFMHRQARLLAALVRALGIGRPLLVGHSDGGSIALLHAAARPSELAAAVVMAPHIRVEPVSLTSIAAARRAYLEGDLRTRLARHHADPDSAFWGWNDVWLSDAFRSWSIEAEIAPIGCPLLAIQGVDDEYGTLAQIEGIAARVPQTQTLELAHCGHSPHRDQPDQVIAAVRAFVAGLA